MTNPAYIVRYHCHVCGRMHLVSQEFPLPDGPTEPCTLPVRNIDMLGEELLVTAQV